MRELPAPFDEAHALSPDPRAFSCVKPLGIAHAKDVSTILLGYETGDTKLPGHEVPTDYYACLDQRRRGWGRDSDAGQSAQETFFGEHAPNRWQPGLRLRVARPTKRH